MRRQTGYESATFDPAERPVAIFDWDNTVVKNDIGDATFFWMLENDKILQPQGKVWSATSPNLTAAALTSLNTACDSLAVAGAPLPTRSSTSTSTAPRRLSPGRW